MWRHFGGDRGAPGRLGAVGVRRQQEVARILSQQVAGGTRHLARGATWTPVRAPPRATTRAFSRPIEGRYIINETPEGPSDSNTDRAISDTTPAHVVPILEGAPPKRLRRDVELYSHVARSHIFRTARK